LFYAILSAILSSVVVGFTYDLYGRKVLILINFLTMAVLVAITPLTAPSIVWLTVVRVIIQVNYHYVANNPLGVDYVKAVSRGRLTAYQNTGLILGELFTFLVLFTVTKGMSE